MAEERKDILSWPCWTGSRLRYSIVVPVYNVSPYLRETLDSILSQTFDSWEAICVDDGSTDGSDVIIDEYAARDRRFRVVHQRNLGVSVSRNVGIRMARGEYLTFVDADDKLDRSWLQVADERIRLNGPDVLRLGLKRWHSDGLVTETHQPNAVLLKDSQAIVRWAWLNLLSGGWSCVCFIRRDEYVVKFDLRFPVDVKVREDLLFLLSVMSKIESFEQYNYCGYYYRERSGSACGGRRDTASAIRFSERILTLWHETFPVKVADVAHDLTWRRMMDEIWASCLETVSNDDYDARTWSLFFRSNGNTSYWSCIAPKWRLGFFVLVYCKSRLGVLSTNKLYAVGSWGKKMIRKVRDDD